MLVESRRCLGVPACLIAFCRIALEEVYTSMAREGWHVVASILRLASWVTIQYIMHFRLRVLHILALKDSSEPIFLYSRRLCRVWIEPVRGLSRG